MLIIIIIYESFIDLTFHSTFYTTTRLHVIIDVIAKCFVLIY